MTPRRVDRRGTTDEVASIPVVEGHFTDATKLIYGYGLSACANSPRPQGTDS